MAVTKDGKILCVYENGERDYCEKLTVALVDPKWLAAGKPAELVTSP
jgi:hypothetical protein